MKKFIVLSLAIFSLTAELSAQKIKETGFEASINRISIPKAQNKWNLNESTPTFLSVGVIKSWYNQSRMLSFRKEIGLNLQHEDINFSSGGLGAQTGYDGDIYSLFINPSLLAHFQFSQTVSADIGPSMDFLVAGYNDLVYWYHSREAYNNFNKQIKSFNRDYFKNPSFGIKSRLALFSPEENTTLGLTFTYFWSKADYSDFYIKNYTKLGIFLSFGDPGSIKKKGQKESD